MAKILNTGADVSSALGEPVFETISPAPLHSFYWHRHDYPAPIAKWNYHPEYELHLITHTCGKFFVGDYLGLFEPGQLVLVGPNLPHAWFSDLPENEHVACGRDVVLQFRGEMVAQLAGTCPEFERIVKWLALARQGFEFQGDVARQGAQLMLAMEDQDPLARLLGFLELLKVLASDREGSVLASASYNPMLQGGASEIISQVLHYLSKEYASDVRMGDVAAMVGMNESTFSRFFKRTTGESFVVFLHRLRIRQACKMLLDERLSISDICFQVGYNNLSNFNRHFLSEMHLTPTRYRRKMLARSLNASVH
ncbi:AraC family transcriptional regulator [Phytohalomonas tamaricis]|uniref:AraC family transcriptional regulator n=1 Tax=Phytohalomonas tamaricis TaxID=2081032 RepID=UPI000D0B87D4|nr:AraC family transcriptional regulator [Phytohalomonas tamaricis]